MKQGLRNWLIGASVFASFAVVGAWVASPELLAATSTGPVVRLLAARKAGTMTERPVSVSNTSSSFSSVDLELGYDATSAAPIVKGTGDASGASVTTNKRAAGRLAVVMANAKPMKNGTVLVVQYPAGSNPHVSLRRASIDEQVAKLQ